MSATRQPLSAVIITLNAATQLEECLRSVAFCDEIVVVDSGSTDGTVDLAERYGARVIQSEWRGFGPQKQFAVEQARHEWVLCVDADERVSEQLGKSIEAVLAVPAGHAFRFARRNRFMGRYLRHGEGYPDWSVRLFHRSHACWSADPVHEKVVTDASIETLSGDLLHESAETMERYLAKQDRYTTLAAEAALEAGRRGSVLRLFLSPLLRFVKLYFLRLGFLDGFPGLLHILIGCRNSYFKHAKLLAVGRRKNVGSLR